jgi:hypothetical protein
MHATSTGYAPTGGLFVGGSRAPEPVRSKDSTPVDLFVRRTLKRLTTDTTLRGAWAEEVVGHFLSPDPEFPDQWSYFDLAWRGLTISVRHAVNAKANFAIERKSVAFDTVLASTRRTPPYTVQNPEGWLGHPALPPQYWCDVYIFAWLPEMDSNETVMDFDAWRFVALSRGQMYRHFHATQNTVSVSVLKEFDFVGGDELAERVVACSAIVDPTTPALDRRTQEEIREALAHDGYSATRSG